MESVEKLVSENELEDPAILNASKHAPLPHSSQNNPIPPSAKPNDIWASPFPQSRTPIPTQNEFQPNNDTYLSSDIDSLVDQYKNDLSLGPSGISKLNLSPIGGEMKPPFTVLREMVCCIMCYPALHSHLFRKKMIIDQSSLNLSLSLYCQCR